MRGIAIGTLVSIHARRVTGDAIFLRLAFARLVSIHARRVTGDKKAVPLVRYFTDQFQFTPVV